MPSFDPPADFQETGVSRDAFSAVNAFDVETRPVGYEVSVVLAPGFAIDPADATNTQYREFVFDDAGLNKGSA